MFKSFLFSLIATVLIFSILAPSIETLLHSQYDSVMVTDFNEEENNQKENEKKTGEKDLFFVEGGVRLKFQDRSLTLGHGTHASMHSNIPQEIFSPPPEHFL